MGLTLDEQELQINMCGRTDTVQVYTSYPHWIKRLDKYCEEHPDNWKCTGDSFCDGQLVGRFYECPKELLKLAAKKRFVSDEQRKASAERLAKYRQQQGEQVD